MARWLNGSIFWKACAYPIDLLLQYPDESGVLAQCPNPEAFTAFRPMVSLLQFLARDRTLRLGIFNGNIYRVSESHLRFAQPAAYRQSIWIAGDSTLDCISRITWSGKWISDAHLLNCG